MRYWIVLLLASVSTLTAAPQTFLYVANGSAQTISGYSVDATNGTLTALAGSPFTVGANLTSLAADPTGRFLYVTSPPNAVFTYTIDWSTGALTAVAGLTDHGNGERS